MNVNVRPQKLSSVTWEDLLAADTVVDDLRPDEMTAAMYAKKTGLSISRCHALLRQRCDAGILTRRKWKQHAWLYRPKG